VGGEDYRRRNASAQTKTEGAIKAGNGRYTFDLARLHEIEAGRGYPTAHGPLVEETAAST